MSILDNLLGQFGGGTDVANLAAKVGLSPEHVQQAVAALAKFHPMQGDTAEGAAAATGLPLDKVQELIGHIGGEGSLANYASMLDKDGDGNPLNDIAGMAAGFFGKK
ncbi:hypothetical protein ACFQ1E_12355 [Sphingomonas canadensis]|uniref:DUF937 domain-containing protein n=1 Tax=Sphingomonas canadensis TaxID=1219257 RepID=A0ABW3HAE0_9SPHN|nr:hypothetical protein [Sphingomonas canadensis]MCW3836733.1 hypothetical protein [Sphingomonas canadensis]